MNEVEEQTVLAILAGKTRRSTDGTAQPGMFQIVFIDTFDYDHAVCGEVDNLQEAIRRANALVEGQNMARAVVYDDNGEERFRVER